MIWFPACCSTSAAGCQEQPEWQWADPRDPLEICPFTHRPTLPPPREGRTRGRHPTPAGATPRKHSSRRAAGFLLWAFGSLRFRASVVARAPRVEVGTLCSRRVTVWHRTRLSSAAAFQSHAGRVSAARRGGISLFSRELFGNVNWFDVLVAKC